MAKNRLILGVAAVALVALGGCQPIGELTGKYVPRQPEVAGGSMGTAAPSMAPASMAAPAALFAELHGTNEVPMNFSAATGSARISFDRTSGIVSWTVTYEGLRGEATGAHFHGPAAEGENAGVQVNLAQNGLVSPLEGSALLTADQAAQLLGGLWYVNIHSTGYPDGEIRGQVKPAM